MPNSNSRDQIVSQQAADPIGMSQADFTEIFVPVEDGVRLRVMCWQPQVETPAAPIVFVAGWVSVVDGWAEFLRELTCRHPVYYVESREKKSAEVTRRGLRWPDFAMPRLADDLIAVCRGLGLNPAETIVAGSSFGATAILEALKHQALGAKAAFLIGPNSDFKAPPVLNKVIYLPAFFYHGFKYVLLWYLRTFRVDAKKEPEQMARYELTLRSANPRRLQLSAIASLKYRVWSDLETIAVPVGMAYATTDKLHSAENIERMVQAIPNAAKVPCPSNKFMHGAEIAPLLEAFVEEHTRRIT
jgi:pimeloyl-ACP methyl ester carboxylesterase